MEERILNREQVLERLSFRPAELYRELKSGALAYTTGEGGALQIKEADIEAFEAKRKQTTSDLHRDIDGWLATLRPLLPAPEGEPAAIPEEPGERVPPLADALLLAACRQGYEAVHIDPIEGAARVLIRRHGRLSEWGRMGQALADSLRVALKEKAGIGEEPPHRGFCTVACEGSDEQVEVSATATLMGEHLHMALLGTVAPKGLAALGYTAAQAEAVDGLLDGRPGLFLVAGPADAMASRHRLALANRLAAGNRLVLSLEHRRHLKSELLIQLEIPAEVEGFDPLLRHALAMQPDVVFVDDVRNEQEAAALSELTSAGIAVVAQIRAGSNTRALLRLLALELDPVQVSRDLLAIVSRRSVRRLCEHCRQERAVGDEEAAAVGLEAGTIVADAGGCDACGGAGYQGSLSLFDLWPREPALMQLIENLEPPGQVLRGWGRDRPLGLVHAVADNLREQRLSPTDAAALVPPPPIS